jgi:hypothetical protein
MFEEDLFERVSTEQLISGKHGRRVGYIRTKARSAAAKDGMLGSRMSDPHSKPLDYGHWGGPGGGDFLIRKAPHSRHTDRLQGTPRM